MYKTINCFLESKVLHFDIMTFRLKVKSYARKKITSSTLCKRSVKPQNRIISLPCCKEQQIGVLKGRKFRRVATISESPKRKTTMSVVECFPSLWAVSRTIKLTGVVGNQIPFFALQMLVNIWSVFCKTHCGQFVFHNGK